MTRCICVRFDDSPISYEPAKWRRILAENIPYQEFDASGVRELILCFWLSEYTNSLNIVIRLNTSRAEALQLRFLRRVFRGAKEVKVFGEEGMAKSILEQAENNRQASRPAANVVSIRDYRRWVAA